VAGDFSFPAAAIDVEIPVPDHCTEQEAGLNNAMSELQQVNADIASLKHVIATGTLAEKAEARRELAEIRSKESPAAKQAVAAAQAALARAAKPDSPGMGRAQA
jgi:peptidoglycan hydrolase CwlO-like protein